MTATAHPPAATALGADALRLRDRAWAAIERGLLRDLAVLAVDTPSPTGEEGVLADVLARAMRELDVPARTQPLDDLQANAVGELRGHGRGPVLLLYAPIDTLHDGDPAADVPWTGRGVARPDMLPRAATDGDLVTGLGAGNPKGHAVCCIAAAAALAAAGVRLPGTVLVGLGAGGMPTNARPVAGRSRRNTGQGVGATFLLEQGGHPDAAVLAKPGWSVAWEEVGLAWFEIRIRGTHTYVGSRHRLPYRNAIADAAAVVAGLEAWFPGYAQRHTDGLVAPQGVVAHLRAGAARTAAVTPAEAEVLVDLRLSPRTTPRQAERELRAAVAVLAAEHGADAEVELVLAVPGSSTPPGALVVRSAIAAWEAVEGAAHRPATGTSGATDANILRLRGVPTARVGMPKVPDLAIPGDFALGMNVVDVAEMERLTRLLVQVAVDVCTRAPEEVES